MKNVQHYSALTFSALLVSAIILGLTNKEFGVMGVILVSVGWVTTRIVKEGFTALLVLMTQDDDEAT